MFGADVPFFTNNQDSLIREIGNITIKQSFPLIFFLLNVSYKIVQLEKLYDFNHQIKF